MVCDTNNLIHFVIGKEFAMHLIRLDIVQPHLKIYNFIQIYIPSYITYRLPIHYLIQLIQ
jgi:hypothetical protein